MVKLQNRIDVISTKIKQKIELKIFLQAALGAEIALL